MRTSAPSIAMVAGEASGDLLAGVVLDGVRARWPAARTFGIGGPQMASRGFDAWWPHDKLAVRGYAEVLRHYREIAAIRRALRARLLDDPPDVFIGIDAPDFNLGLEADLKQRGIPTLHFISPSIWAWRGGRIEGIRRSVDHMLCVFPFEPAIYHAAGIAASFVGYPLASGIPLEPDRAAARALLGLPGDATVVAVLPGSRTSEITYNGPVFAQTVAQLRRARPGLRFVLPTSARLRPALRAQLSAAGCADAVQLVDGQSHPVLAACDVALVASGTATLETALFKRPMVIAYRMHWLSWQLMRRMGYQPWVGLPNILCRDFVVPELLQQQATPDALASALLGWLDDPARVAALQARFHELHQTLRRDTAALTRDAIEKILAR